ncbi:MAG: IPTL-CTERM sorting domain-containing protein, partial [Planctomycetes bacterium]|nr:IPTL-CTERM sorting domain-containing protein [Planctomycetota bacterium]
NVNQEDCNNDGEGDACELDEAERDNDFDGVCNGDDGCPDDPFKSIPGDEHRQAPGWCGCGCGDPDLDSDGDGPVCPCCSRPDDCFRFNQCPDDPGKVAPGICGCGVPDEGDEDGDGFLDCVDQCRGVDDAIFAPACDGAIPTLSEWGLAILALLLLVGGKVYFRPDAPRL